MAGDIIAAGIKRPDGSIFIDTSLKLESSVDFVVTEYKPNRSAAQNRLYWGWLTDFERTNSNEHGGKTREEWHDYFKREYLTKIYERDNEEYAQTIATLRNVWRHGMQTEAKNMMDFVIRETSTSDASVDQFSEYLGLIERWAHTNGIELRTDSRLYAEAFGHVKNH